MSAKKGWVAVDLDGTLAHYESFEDPIGEPIPAMLQRVKRWIAEGLEVRIFTARVARPENRQDQQLMVMNWCLKHLGRYLRVTCIKDEDCLEIYDDRAVQVEKNTGRLIGQSTRGL